MECERFLEQYSDYRDGNLSSETAASFKAHLASCRCCARYDRVMRRGVELLASMPCQETSDDFMPRLRHRLYNIDAGIFYESGRWKVGSAALIGVAAVGLLALFWLPFATTVPVEMELPPVAAQAPPEAVGVPALFSSGPFVHTLLEEQTSYLDGDVPEWPPRSHVHRTVILDASRQRVEPTTDGR